MKYEKALPSSKDVFISFLIIELFQFQTELLDTTFKTAEKFSISHETKGIGIDYIFLAKSLCFQLKFEALLILTRACLLVLFE